MGNNVSQTRYIHSLGSKVEGRQTTSKLHNPKINAMTYMGYIYPTQAKKWENFFLITGFMGEANE